jgi:hypothetical protein
MAKQQAPAKAALDDSAEKDGKMHRYPSLRLKLAFFVLFSAVMVIRAVSFSAHNPRTNGAPQEEAHTRLLHIVHIVVDDLGWGDVSWRADRSGQRDSVSTPELDSLLRRGVLLDHFYTPKDCAPSRASMMTGRWPFRVGYYSNPGSLFSNRCFVFHGMTIIF